jgi:predicted amidohydrolase
VLQEAAAEGCTALFLPECFSFLGATWQESLAASEPLDGPTIQRYQELAK